MDTNTKWQLSEPIPCIMGCTSSAPNMPNNQNATEKKFEAFVDDEGGLTIKEDNNAISTIEENGVNEIKVLPCDTLADPIKLDSNNKSIIDTSEMDMDKVSDIPASVNVLESETKAKEIEDVQIREKLSSLEDVVEKVVELHVADSLLNSTHVSKPESEQTTQIDSVTENAIEVENHRTSDKIEDCESENDEQKEDPPEEALSPSQSTSSRATRWEAFADIAAELPPSLTVDPLTGQIYALSK